PTRRRDDLSWPSVETVGCRPVGRDVPVRGGIRDVLPGSLHPEGHPAVLNRHDVGDLTAVNQVCPPILGVYGAFGPPSDGGPVTVSAVDPCAGGSVRLGRKCRGGEKCSREQR